MTKLIVGTYHSREEAINAINIFELTGHESKNIIVLTNKENAKKLNIKGLVKTDTPESNQKKPSFSNKFKDFFTRKIDFELDTVEKLVDYGISQEEAEKCLADVKAGKIVVLADDRLRMGHESTNQLVTSADTEFKKGTY